MGNYSCLIRWCRVLKKKKKKREEGGRGVFGKKNDVIKKTKGHFLGVLKNDSLWYHIRWI